MTGHNDDENEPLVSVGDSLKDYSNEASNAYIYSRSFELAPSEIVTHINDENSQLIKRNGYGSIKAHPGEKLTYSWKNVDVFGEAPTNGTPIRSLVKKITSCFSNGANNPIPRKHLIKNVSGIAEAGELLAVMGSSGAGKTTLLNALAFRSPPGVRIAPSAIRALNGAQIDATELRSRCAYVQQDDLFIGSLTAREHLIFQAMVRMDRELTYKQKVRRVDEVILELSLGKCQHTTIGIPGRMKGLSGGERKRLAFASESLTDPALLLCDEPTSGLDSFMAHSVLQVLKGLSLKGKTIILTIHQPSSELYGLFDKILLMAEGRVAFLGTPSQATAFFDQLGAPCPANYNPVDYYIQLLAMAPGKEDEGRESIKKVCDAFAIGNISKELAQRTIYLKNNSFLETMEGSGMRKYRATWFTQFRAILWRAWVNVLKEPLLIKVRLLQTFMVSILIGIIFYGQKIDQDGVMNINGAIFIFLTNMTFQNTFGVINTFCSELPIFYRETRSRLYRADTYFLGKTIAELPLFLIIPILFTSVVYPMIGLQPGFQHFLMTTLIVTLVANVATSFGYLISCVSSTVTMALSIGPTIIIPFLLFGGFFLNSGSVPVYFKWLSYLSWFKYGNEALMINQWSSVMEGDILCNRLNSTCPSSGKIILETLNFSEDNLYFDLFALCGLILSFRLVAYLCLVLRTRTKE